MEYFLMFIIHCVMFIVTVITTLFINEYSTLLAIAFAIVYLISVKLVSDELKQ